MRLSHRNGACSICLSVVAIHVKEGVNDDGVCSMWVGLCGVVFPFSLLPYPCDEVQATVPSTSKYSLLSLLLQRQADLLLGLGLRT